MLSSKLKMAAVLAGLLLAPALSYAQGPGGGRGGFGGGFGRGGFGGGNSLSGLLRMEEVQKEIAVTDEQKAALDKAAEERRAARGNGGGANFGDFANLSEEERTKRIEELRKTMEEASKKADEQIKSLLKPEQVARLNQLLIQREGLAALNRADVQKELGLSEEQVGKLKAVAEARNAGGGSIGGRNFQEMSEEELRKLREEREARTKKYTDDMNAVLTADQKAAFIKMQGAKFTFPAGGGFGGPGGGGRGGRGGPGGGAGGGRPRPE